MLRRSAPSWLIAKARHELIRRPSTRTVHAPHWPRSHPFLVPVSCRRSRKRSSSVTRGSSSSASRRAPLTVRLMERFMLCSDQCYRPTGSSLSGSARRGVIRWHSPDLALIWHIRRYPPLFKRQELLDYPDG